MQESDSAKRFIVRLLNMTRRLWRTFVSKQSAISSTAACLTLRLKSKLASRFANKRLFIGTAIACDGQVTHDNENVPGQADNQVQLEEKCSFCRMLSVYE